MTAEQRQAELRLVLKSSQEPQTPAKAPADTRRQLSVQEKADLRHRCENSAANFHQGVNEGY